MKRLRVVLNFPAQLWDKIDQRLCCSLPYPFRLWWKRLWVRTNEFHPSLNIDPDYVARLGFVERDHYHRDLERRRSLAHQRDLDRTVRTVS
jgi:hypothetical protein